MELYTPFDKLRTRLRQAEDAAQGVAFHNSLRWLISLTPVMELHTPFDRLRVREVP